MRYRPRRYQRILSRADLRERQGRAAVQYSRPVVQGINIRRLGRKWLRRAATLRRKAARYRARRRYAWAG